MPDCENCVYKVKVRFDENTEPVYEDYERAHEHAKELLFNRGGPLKEGRLRILRHYNGIAINLNIVKRRGHPVAKVLKTVNSLFLQQTS